jgi:hypothetical protein
LQNRATQTTPFCPLCPKRSIPSAEAISQSAVLRAGGFALGQLLLPLGQRDDFIKGCMERRLSLNNGSLELCDRAEPRLEVVSQLFRPLGGVVQRLQEQIEILPDQRAMNPGLRVAPKIRGQPNLTK